MKSGIYRITCLMNGKFYIGSAINIKVRKIHHFKLLRGNRHHNKNLQNSWNKYGEKFFDFDIIEYCEITLLIEREQYYINYMQPQFNICQIANSPLGRVISEETKIKISNNLFGHTHSIEMRIKMSHIMSNRYKNKNMNVRKRLFTNEQIKEIRTIKNMTQKEIAKKYNVSKVTIQNILNYISYKDVK